MMETQAFPNPALREIARPNTAPTGQRLACERWLERRLTSSQFQALRANISALLKQQSARFTRVDLQIRQASSAWAGLRRAIFAAQG
jgi:hypothetical protein